MSSEQEPDSRDELRERFRADLKRPVSERYYSEDELVTIFDSAGDYYDDYLRFEVIVLGSRLYPDSEELMARRAIFYSERDPASFKNFLEDHPDLSNPLVDIMRMSDTYPDRGNSQQAMEHFLEEGKLDEDETVIQFVRMAHSLGLDKWLVDNLGRIRSKVSYLPTLLYEVAVTAEESPVLDTVAIAMLEELTEIEPYCADYWTLLSFTYTRHNRPDDAASAIDYALAIEPDNIEALKAKLHIFPADSHSEEIDEILERVHRLDPADAETAYMCVLRAEDRGNRQKIIDLISGMEPSVRATMSIAGKAVDYIHPELSTILGEAYDYGTGDSDEWKRLAERAYATGSNATVSLVMQTYEAKSGSPLNHDYLLYCILYDMKSYETAISMFVNAEPGGTLRLPENLYRCYAMYITMLLRTRRMKMAADAASTMLDMLDTESRLPGSVVERHGMRMFLKDVAALIQSASPSVDWDRYDPLGLDREKMQA